MRPFVLVALLLAACGPRLIGRPEQRIYFQNADCRVERPDDPSRWAEATMCGAASFDPETVAATPLDLDADPVTPAAFVALCAAGTRCDPASTASWTALAFAWDLATRLDADAVAAALARGSLPAYMQGDFVGRYRAAAKLVVARVDALGTRWRDLFLRPLTTARADRAAADAALASWAPIIGELEADADRALLANAPEAATLEAALRMRRNYVAACRDVRAGVDACLGDGDGRRLTALIHRVGKALGDEALLDAESELASIPDLSDPRTSIWLAIHAALDAERARFGEYQAARDQGISDAVLAQRWPEPPLDLPELDSFLGVAPVADNNWYRGEGTEDVVEAVRAVKRSKARATIQFRKDVYKGYESTGCYETSKVDGFDEYGHVIYRTNCTGERAYTDDRTLKPVTVPWVEVASVKAGEVIHLVVDRKTRKGHVAWVGKARPKGDVYTSDTERVQTREWRVTR